MTGGRLWSVAHRAGIPGVLVALIASAAASLGRIYDGSLASWLVTGAGAGAVLVGTAARRLPSWQATVLSVLSMCGYLLAAGWYTAHRAELPEPVPPLLVEAAANGVPRLLTAMIPVEPVPDTVLVPVVAGWLAGLAAVELAVRGGRVLLGYLPPVLLFAASSFVVGPNAGPGLGHSLGFVVAGVLGLALTAGPAPVASSAEDSAGQAGGPLGRPVTGRPVTGPAARLRLRSTLLSAAGVGAVLAVVALTAPMVLARIATTGVDPRRYITPPVLDSLDENPLARISGWALDPDQPLFDLRVGDRRAGTPPPPARPAEAVRVRLAVLLDYDGVTWHIGGTYRSAGRVLPAVDGATGQYPSADAAAGPADTLRQEITIGELSGQLLPAVAAPSRVDGIRVGYDADSGTLLHPEGLRPGLAYTVDSVPPRLPLDLLGTADVPAGEPVARSLRVPAGAPAGLTRLARRLAEGVGAPYQRALAIEQFLAEHYRLVADAPSGHAYPNLEFFLFGPGDGGGLRGTSEQFATAYAVLGRLVGLPTRVVVGFTATAGGGTVCAADALAWPEVLFAGIGWVPFDPLPRPDTEPRPVEQELRPAPRESPPPAENLLPPVEPARSPAPAAAAPPRRSPAIHLVVLAMAVMPLAGAAGWSVGVVLLRRRQRRRRLGTGTPADRVCGAWQEVVDALRLAGRPAAAHLSATEVVRHAGGLPGAARLPALDRLATLVNAAVFAPGQVTGPQVHETGEQATGYVRALRASQSWWRRIGWSLRPGPLYWHRVPRGAGQRADGQVRTRHSPQDSVRLP
ncbi:DUF3488 and transglutaminase-like domain-containing protein [Solwaraspora sp. WMMB335]|uniref:DUF3488 and transglutaminase-like domain-containing protein n=1 Tax=Solwaraspora sp. WMMB335 TaxID=3404118 RepID=UPI003B95EB5D